MIFYSASTQYQSQILASAVGVIFGLCKGQNFTDGWLESRIRRVSIQYPDLEITDKVTKEIVTAFSSRYVKQGQDINVVSNFLKSVYPSFDDTALNSLNWVIEQAQGQSSTHGLAYARAIQEYQGRPLILMDMVPRLQYVQFATLVAHIAADPWGSLYKPAVTASQYPDLANIGQELMRETDRQFRAYDGGWISGGSYSRTLIKAIAATIRAQQTSYIEHLADPASVIKACLPEVEIMAINDNFYLYTNDNTLLSQANLEALIQNRQTEMRAERMAAENMQPVGWIGQDRRGQPFRDGAERAHVAQAPVMSEEAIATARRGWDNRARQLPNNAMRLDPVGLNALMAKAIDANPDFQAIRDLSSIAIQATRQGPLKPYGEDPNNIQILNRYCSAYDEALQGPLNNFGLTLAALLPNKGPDNPTVAYNPATMVTEAQFNRPRRRSLHAARQAGPRGARGRRPPPAPEPPLDDLPDLPLEGDGQ